MIRNDFTGKELCLEGYPDNRFLALCEEARPDQVLFVPDDPSQQTSDHGWDFEANDELLRRCVDVIKNSGMKVSLFVNPDPSEPAKAAAVGADRIEIYTGPYGACHSDEALAAERLAEVSVTAHAAKEAGLGVNAGHDLTPG